MAKRGRKPINFEQLDLWDAEWYLAFYRLREGGELPVRTNQWWTQRRINFSLPERLAMLKRMSLEEYWAHVCTRRLPKAPEVPWPPLSANRELAETMWAEEIAQLTRLTDAKAIERRQSGFEIWQALWQATTPAAVKKACRRWADLNAEDPFPKHLVALINQFLAMKSDPRFPRSPGADDARLNYMAAGMAGVCIGISPLTAIHRLRTMKHAPDGPLVWEGLPQRKCHCWRCDRARQMNAFKEALEAFRKESTR